MSIVLVVDDSPMDRATVKGLLADAPGLELRFAEGGTKALEVLRDESVGVVVTDLQMPDMDGLELVTQIRFKHPEVPVILMTAHGSEQLAVEALEQGASGYVPKAHLATKLLGAVRELLSQVHADQTYESLLACFQSTDFELQLTNDTHLIEPLVELVQQMVGGMGLCDPTGSYRVGVALKEALLNAIYRGNLELGPERLPEVREEGMDQAEAALVRSLLDGPLGRERRVRVRVTVRPDEARIVIGDDGPGFDHAATSAAAEPLSPEGGRGLVLMRTFMDEVRFNSRGNEVTLVKRRE